jgi:Mlc titration factor MtfA (ptsG expression regulator)
LLAQPFTSEWLNVLTENVLLYATLSAAEQAKVRDYVRVFVAEKHWEGCGGLKMTDEIRVTIAAHVGILVLGLEDQFFDRVLSILVYPAAYVAQGSIGSPSGIVIEGDSAREGETSYRGPIVLAWSDVLTGGRNERHGSNVVLHEFAHQLDMLNGRNVDGAPPLETEEQHRRWTEVFGRHYRRLVHDCEHGQPALLDCYGATNPGEYFAVATEMFFMRPQAFEDWYPALYSLFSDFYRQQPLSRRAP